MSGRKRKSVINFKEVADYRQKLRRPGGAPLKLTNRERKKFTVKSPYIQEFSLPENIIYYIVRNPAFGNGHLKLISSCKSLLRLNRILPIKKLRYVLENNSSNDEKYDEDDENDCYKWKADGALINLKNQFFKLWIYDAINIESESIPNIASTMVRHIHKFSLRKIQIDSQLLTFKELQILVSGGHLEDVHFCDVVVKNDDESIIEFEKVFDLICCNDMCICFPDEHHGIGKITADKLIEILSSDQLPPESDISLINIPESFDISSFSEFLKANMTGRQHSFEFTFADEISDAYKNQLQNFVNEIIQMRGIYAHTVPNIYFYGLDQEAYDELSKMRTGDVEGILRKS